MLCVHDGLIMGRAEGRWPLVVVGDVAQCFAVLMVLVVLSSVS